LLIGVHELAVAFGGIRALRVIGVIAVAGSIFLASSLVRRITAGLMSRPSRFAMATPVLVAATFMATPLFGTTQVDGELLTVPLILAGVVALLRAFDAQSPLSSTGWALVAGAAATGAAMTKQNAIDVFVFAVALLWSLPVKVRDPRLHRFDALLRSTRGPTWVVVSGTSLYTWGVDASAADRTLANRYHQTIRIGRYYVWHVNTGGR
jgi:4-amino-4-deoxy-L-arabinose transferase-like glycosyltransferase